MNHLPSSARLHDALPIPQRRRLLQMLGACAGALSLPAAQAESYPNRPVKLIVPFAAGGGTDLVGRLMAQRMSDLLNQPVIVDNRTGAGGSVGSDVVAKSPADGYTMLLGTVSTHAINPALYVSLPFDPVRAFTPISLVATVPCIGVINAKLPFTSFAQLVVALRANPGKYTFGSQGIGGIGHLIGEMVNTQAQVQSVHVPYRGAALAIQDLVAGNIDILYDTPPALLPLIQSGALRPLVVTSRKRIAVLSDVPTSVESGFPQLVAATWNALFSSASLPAGIQKTLADAAIAAVRTPAVIERLKAISADPVGSTPAELATFLHQEIVKWAPVVKTSGARLE